MLQFAREYMLYGLLLLPLLTVLIFWYRKKRRSDIGEFGDPSLVEALMPDASESAFRWKSALLLTGMAMLIIGASGPRIGSQLKEVEQKGREIIIALDVSSSMLAEDIKPSRIERAKQVISRMVDEMTHDRIGLIIFAGDAYTQIPITDDYPSVKMFLQTTGPDMVSRQGTAIGSAIRLAIRSFPTETEEPGASNQVANKAIVVITDGENHEDDALEAAQDARDKGIRTYTVGLGDPAGVPIPVSPGSSEKKRRKDGSVVVSKLNEELLIEMAQIGDGAYIPGSRINSLMDELDKLQQTEFKKKVYADFAERYQYFIGLALLLLLLDAIILRRKNPIIQKMNLFNESP